MGSYRSIAAVAVIVFASALVGIGVHHLLESGNCSTTGYTRYGPAPHCSSSAVGWGIVLPIGTFLVIGAGVAGAPNLFALIGPLFLAIGIGALTADTGGSGAGRGFGLVFGGCFALVGAALLAVPAWSAVRSRGGGMPRSRMAIGVAACVAALAAAAGVASLLPTEHASGSASTTAGSTNPTGASFPEIGATDPNSLYRTDNFKRALTVAAFYVGDDAKVRSLGLVPGGVNISVDVGDGRGKDISIDSTGGYLGGDVEPLPGTPRTFALSALDPSSPVTLLERVGADRVDHMTATPTGDGGVSWLAYPKGSGAPTRLAGH